MRIERLAELNFYTEGPVVDGGGRLFFTTLRGGKILVREADGGIREWASSACPNGQFILAGGDHIVCDSEMGMVRRYDPAGRSVASVFATRSVPNDLVADRNGNIYFTDSVRHKGRLFFVGVDGHTRVLVDGLDYPNGLAFSPGERWLYVAESYRNRILRLDVRDPMQRSVLAELPAHGSGREEDNLPDGLKVDEAGNLWVAHYGMGSVQVLSPEGRLLRTIGTGMPLTSNLCLCGAGEIVVTGGSGEPGPGAVVKIYI